MTGVMDRSMRGGLKSPANSPVSEPGSSSFSRLEIAALTNSLTASSSQILSQNPTGSFSWIPDHQKLQGNKLLFVLSLG